MGNTDMRLSGTLTSPIELGGHLTNETLQGLSAYEVAVKRGYTGTEAEWLASLKGETGATPDISIGNVTTGQPGTNAEVSVSGTPENPVMDFTIPRGDVGATPNMTIGTVVTGEEGTQAQATITGTPENPVLNLTIPKGNTGDDGFDPVVEVTKDGNTATVSVTDATHTTEVNIIDGYTPQKNVDYFDGHSPKITGAKSQGTTFIYSDGEQIGTIADGQDGYTPRKGVDYFDGHTPAISGEKIDDTTFIYADGVRIATVLDGLDGNSPVITTVKSGKTTSILADSVVIGTVSDGADGHSPEITANKVGKVLTILSDGQTIGTVSDGVDGEDAVTPVITTNKSGTTTTIYSNGVAIGTVEDGADGSSPVITATKSEGITTIKADGVDIATINDGISGEDGYSPTASVTKSGGVSTLTVTDESGTTTTQILDGTGMTASDPNNDGNIVLSSVVGVQIDEEPTNGSTNAISSGSVYNELSDVKGRLTQSVDDIMSDLTEIDGIINSEIGQETTVTASPTLTDGYSIVTSGANAGAVVTNATNSVSDEIDLTGAKEITFYYTGGNPYGNIFLYDAQSALISTYGIPSSSNKSTIAVPQNASYARYFCMTSRKGVVVEIKKEIQGTIYEEIETKQDKNLGVENAGKYLAIDDEGNIYPKALTTDTTKTKYAPFTPVKPLIAEMMADFAWCSMIIPNAFTGKNVTITISGNAGETTVVASAISPNGLTLSDIWTTNWIGGVISPDGVNFTVCNFKYVSDDTIEVFPALSENISGGVLSTLMFDSGSSYVGLHLTENGYKAYMQNLFNKNPKHCEVGKYVARFRPEIDTASPFVWYGGTIPAAAYRFVTKNKALEWLNNPTTKFYGYQYSTQWQEHTTKSGAYWDVDLKGKSGYLEAYVFAICNAFNLPTDQELHVIVTIDGVEKLNETINNSICRRIVVDYENATSGRLEVYSNKWYKVNDAAYGFGFGRVTWWVNDLEYDSALFPKGAVIAQEFDSWGVFHDGASGKELERLQNESTGVTVPYTNKSKGDQTSAWGLAYYYENVFNYHPSIAIHDFVINDTNSVDNAGIPATIEGPDEKTYNNKLTSEQYAANMILLGQLSISNGIQPILMGACQHGSTNYYTFTNALIDAMSEEVN